MRRHHVLFALLLVAGITSVVCTYYFGIVPRYEAYQALVDQEGELRARIGELEKKFSRTQPPAVVEAWQRQVQPWAQGVSGRVSYFDTLGDADQFKVTMPEEEKQFPKFWYEKERKERMEALAAEIYAADLVAPSNLSEFEPPAPGPAGWDPSVEDVEGWLEEYEFAASFVREMIRAKAQQIETMVIWPKEPIMATVEGAIQRERAGYAIRISTEDFAKYLAEINSSTTFAAIDALKVVKSGALADPEALLNVQFILNRTRFIPAETAAGDEGETIVVRRRDAEPVAAEMKTAMGKKSASSFSEAELARIKALGDQQDPGFFRGILRWFGI